MIKHLCLTRLLVALALALCAVGCATTSGPLPTYVGPVEQRASAGTIVFYRTPNAFGYGMRPDILIDGIKVGWSAPGTQFKVQVASGMRVITCPNTIYAGQRTLEVVVRAGETVYVRTSMQGAAFGGLATIDQVDETQAVAEVANLPPLK